VEENREEFVLFLKSLIEALSSITENKISQGKRKDLKEICVVEIQNVLDQILNFDPMNYSNFNLEDNCWFVLKCIPYVFSKISFIFLVLTSYPILRITENDIGKIIMRSTLFSLVLFNVHHLI